MENNYKKVLVTRNLDDSNNFTQKLKEKGFEIVVFPTIEILPIENEFINKKLAEINFFDWVIFTSVNSVKIFFDKLNKLNLKIDKDINFAVIGEKVQKELRKHNFIESIIPNKFISESLLDSFDKIDLSDKKILIPCSEISRDLIYTKLSEKAFLVEKLHIYQNLKPELLNIDYLLTLLKNDGFSYITFMSPSSINNFFEILAPVFDIKKYILESKSIFICIGETTATKFREVFFKEPIIPEKYTLEGILDLIN